MTTPRTHHKTGAGARIGGDHIALQYVVIAGVVLTALASFTISFTSLLAVAEWQATPEYLAFLTPLMVDLPVVVFSVATIMFRHREQRGGEWAARALAIVMTAVSSSANFLHTASVRGLDGYEDWIGASFNALAPILVLCCTEVLGGLITRPRASQAPVARARAQLLAARVESREWKRKALAAIKASAVGVTS
jgi:hypothetical protein